MQPPEDKPEGRSIDKTLYDVVSRAIGAYVSGGRTPLHEAQLSENVLRTTWLPYFERFLLVTWLVLFTLIFQEQVLDIPANPLERIIIVVIGVWLSLIAMGISLRRSGYREPIGYQARMRRRIGTFFASMLWMVLLSLGFYFIMR